MRTPEEKEKNRLYNIEYRKTHKEQCSAYGKKRYLENIEKIKEYRKSRSDLHKVYMKEYIKERKKEFPWEFHYKCARDRCLTKNGSHPHYEKNNIKMLMTVDDFRYLWVRDKAFEMKRPTIDRINSKDNYSLANCRFLEFFDNMARRVYDKRVC